MICVCSNLPCASRDVALDLYLGLKVFASFAFCVDDNTEVDKFCLRIRMIKISVNLRVRVSGVIVSGLYQSKQF